MEVGPVDVYIIGFPGNKFTGRIAPAILELVENGTIRVLDLLFVTKDADGVVATLEAEDLDQDGAGFLSIDVQSPVPWVLRMPRKSATTSRPTARLS